MMVEVSGDGIRTLIKKIGFWVQNEEEKVRYLLNLFCNLFI